MTTDKKSGTLKLNPGAAPKKPADPFAPRRAPVRPPGPARAKSVSASAPKPPREPSPGFGAKRTAPEGERAERPRHGVGRPGNDRPAGNRPTGDRPQRGPSSAPRPVARDARPDLARVGNVDRKSVV